MEICSAARLPLEGRKCCEISGMVSISEPLQGNLDYTMAYSNMLFLNTQSINIANRVNRFCTAHLVLFADTATRSSFQCSPASFMIVLVQLMPIYANIYFRVVVVKSNCKLASTVQGLEGTAWISSLLHPRQPCKKSQD